MYKYIKRLIDILLSLIILVVFLIPMIIVSIMIKLDSKGPVLFKQNRTGLHGKIFKLYKFRSMTVNNNVLDFKKENEVTNIGKLIRKTSLDELPQIINVLKGDMSFIGPRPWIPEYFECFTKEQKKRVNVLPGITGLAQCMGRNNISIFDKINYDIEYVNKISLKEDIKIIFLTIKIVLSKEGADAGKFIIQNELQELKNNYINVTNRKVITKEQVQ